jgi:hypothetical protein
MILLDKRRKINENGNYHRILVKGISNGGAL